MIFSHWILLYPPCTKDLWILWFHVAATRFIYIYWVDCCQIWHPHRWWKCPYLINRVNFSMSRVRSRSQCQNKWWFEVFYLGVPNCGNGWCILSRVATHSSLLECLVVGVKKNVHDWLVNNPYDSNPLCFGKTSPCILLDSYHLAGLSFGNYDVKCEIRTHWIVFINCHQAALWMVQTVCPSVRPSVRLSVTLFWLCSHHLIIMKFSGVITNDRSDVHAKGQCQGSKVKVTEVNTQLSRFRTVTPVWIHIWWWNDAYSLIMLRRGAL